MRTASISKPDTIGRRERKKAVTRDELIRAGRTYFAEKGLYESRVEDLTQFAGIAKGTFYLYYETKEDLVFAVVMEGLAQLQASLSAIFSKPRTVEEASRTIVEGHVAFFAANPDLMRILHQVRGILKFDRREWLPLRRALTNHLNYVAQLLASGTPRLNAREAHELACFLFGSVSGTLSVQVAVNPQLPLPTRLPRLTEALTGLTRAYVRLEK